MGDIWNKIFRWINIFIPVTFIIIFADIGYRAYHNNLKQNSPDIIWLVGIFFFLIMVNKIRRILELGSILNILVAFVLFTVIAYAIHYFAFVGYLFLVLLPLVIYILYIFLKRIRNKR